MYQTIYKIRPLNQHKLNLGRKLKLCQQNQHRTTNPQNYGQR